MDIITHRADRRSRTIFNTKVDLFPKTGQKERYHSACYDGLMLRLTSSIPSYRKSEEIINRLMWQDDEDKIKSRTLADAVVREGAQIIDYLDAKTQQILEQNHFDCENGKPDKDYTTELSLFY